MSECSATSKARVARDPVAQAILSAAFAVPEQVKTVVVDNRGRHVPGFVGDASALPEYPRTQPSVKEAQAPQANNQRE